MGGWFNYFFLTTLLIINLFPSFPDNAFPLFLPSSIYLRVIFQVYIHYIFSSWSEGHVEVWEARQLSHLILAPHLSHLLLAPYLKFLAPHLILRLPRILGWFPDYLVLWELFISLWRGQGVGITRIMHQSLALTLPALCTRLWRWHQPHYATGCGVDITHIMRQAAALTSPTFLSLHPEMFWDRSGNQTSKHLCLTITFSFWFLFFSRLIILPSSLHTWSLSNTFRSEAYLRIILSVC